MRRLLPVPVHEQNSERDRGGRRGYRTGGPALRGAGPGLRHLRGGVLRADGPPPGAAAGPATRGTRPGHRLRPSTAGLPLAAAVGASGARSPRPTWCRAWWRPSPTTRCGSGVRNLSTIVMDAAKPVVPRENLRLVAAAAVLFLLPDPREALARWLRLLKPGGRIGVTTFGDQDPTWAAVDSLFAPYRPAGPLGPRGGPASRARSPAPTTSTGCSSSAARSRCAPATEPVELSLADAEQWRAFTMTTGQREAWLRVPFRGPGPAVPAGPVPARVGPRRRRPDRAQPAGPVHIGPSARIVPRPNVGSTTGRDNRTGRAAGGRARAGAAGGGGTASRGAPGRSPGPAGAGRRAGRPRSTTCWTRCGRVSRAGRDRPPCAATCPGRGPTSGRCGQRGTRVDGRAP